MSANTKIEWCDHTFNPWWGCQKVGPGCDHCYAETLDKRTGGNHWGPGAERRRTSVKNWDDPVRWNNQEFWVCEECGQRGTDKDLAKTKGQPCHHEMTAPVRQRVFCASMADVFDNAVPVQWRRDLLDLIEATPNLDWLLLTKRIGNAHSLYAEAYLDSARPWPANVWLGATIVNQEEADRDIPKLLAVPAAKRFLSMEPLLGPVDLTATPAGDILCRCNGCTSMTPDTRLDWVIVGGESGLGARPMHPDWARSPRDQCQAAGVPFLFKQWGDWGEPDSIERTGIAHQGWFESDREDGGVPRHEWPGPMCQGVELASMRPEVFKVGKKAAGRLLDGRTWDGFPA